MIETGTQLGAFEITGPLGVGGMGEVYRATDKTLDREVAIKILPDSFASDAGRVARFEQEAKTLASLNHANIAQIHGLERADGTAAIVMELIEGPTLADRIAEGPIAADEALRIAYQIVDALEAAHEKGIVHRDLKPANIKVKDDGTVKVLDFGIAKAFEPLLATSGGQSPVMTTPVTQTGIILGTAAYMSPEQARGKPVDKRTDVWAFGCVLYEMLTGQPAFGGEDVAVTLARIIAHGADTDSLPGTISPAVRHTIALCLEKDPRRRLADIRDVRLGLEGRLEADAPLGARGAVRRPFWRVARLAGAGIVGALVAGATVFVATRPPPAERPVSRFLVTPPATAALANLGGFDLALSPDGSRVAYFAYVGTQRNRVVLRVRDLADLDSRALTDTELPFGTGNANPFFAADGSWIGYRYGGEGLMRAAFSGGPPIKMVDDVPQFLGATVASDGTMIFSSGDGLHRVSTGGGGTPVRLTPEGEGLPVPYISPTLLPGERAVLYSVGNDRVAVFDLDTGAHKVLIEGGQNASYASTGHIVFARETTLMAVPFDADELAVTGEPVAVVQGVRNPLGNTAADYALSATGTLVYALEGGDSVRTGELVWVDREGQIVERALGGSIEGLASPRLSPDGRRVALTTGPNGDLDIWVYSLDGRPPIPLTADGDNGVPAWSPDGALVAFNANRGNGYLPYVVAADGSVLEPEPLRADGQDLSPLAWPAQDELILLQCCGSEDMFVSAALPDAELRDLAVTANLEYDGALSPNGRWLAYVSDRTGQMEIWVKPYPDGVPVRVSSAGGVEPRWSHDGRELFYLAGNAMMSVAVETEDEFSFGAAVELFTGPHWVEPNPYQHSYDVAADGRFLMIDPSQSDDGPETLASFVVVQNWFEELERLVPTE